MHDLKPLALKLKLRGTVDIQYAPGEFWPRFASGSYAPLTVTLIGINADDVCLTITHTTPRRARSSPAAA